MAVSTLFFLQAPYPGLQTTTILPAPKFSDQMALTDAVSVKRAMDGTRYTYVKTKGGRKKVKWTFQLTRNKGLELRAFIQSYFSSQIVVVDHLSRTWLGYLMNNPFEFDTTERAAPARQGWAVGEIQSIALDFEGVLQGQGVLPTPAAPQTPAITFNITAPASGSYVAGQTVTINWTAANVPAGSNISLCWLSDGGGGATWGATTKWLEIGQVQAANGNGSYEWTIPVGFQVGAASEPYQTAFWNYYRFGGYLYANNTPTYSLAPGSVQISPMFAVGGPGTEGTVVPFRRGQVVTITYQVVDAPSGSTVTLGYLNGQGFNFTLGGAGGPEAAFTEIAQVAAVSGIQTYNWTVPDDFPNIAPNYYWFGGYLSSGGVTLVQSSVELACQFVPS